MKLLKFTILFLLSMSFYTNAYALSDWAIEDYKNLSMGGVITSDIIKNDTASSITRLEFSKLVVNIHNKVNPILLEDSDLDKFDDTDNIYVLKAHKAGIVEGKGERIFCPDDLITRQEMAVMISRLLFKISPEYNVYTNQIQNYKNQFLDSVLTADWAMSDMAAICYYGIITGVSDYSVDPLGNATREQAFCMLNRVYKQFIENKYTYDLPNVSGILSKTDKFDVLSISWTPVPRAQYYNVIYIGNNETKTIYAPSNESSIDSFTVTPNQSHIIYVEAVINNSISVISLPVVLDKYTDSITQTPTPAPTPSQPTQQPQKPVINTDSESIKNEQFSSLNEKEQRVFPIGRYFESADEAKEYMVDVTVPVWSLNLNGDKRASTKTIKVNKGLSEDVVKIFTEIFEDPSQFPIKDVGGYYWRNTAGGRISQHSYGTCIDINYNENYYVSPEGVAITGSHWKPGEDPYSIAEDSIVVKTFAKYGWLWGGNAWGEGYNKDYMHFTYLGK